MKSFMPPHLVSTLHLLKKAYSNNDFEDDYYAVVKILYDEMSDRNLAIVLSHFTQKPIHEVTNDIRRAYYKDINCDDVKNKLIKYGYNDWLNEP